MPYKLIATILLLVSSWNALAQQDKIGAMIGSVTGLVANNEGALVEPQCAIDATVDISSAGSDLTAVVDGVASCTGGLGLQITFHATFDFASFSLIGQYTDIPNGRILDQEIVFENTGGLNWTANVAGEAPSPNGPRAYDLQLNITLPKEAIYPGEQYPNTKHISGDLNQMVTVNVPLEIPALSYSDNLSVVVQLTGRWTAKSVPSSSAKPDINGNFSGAIQGVAPLSVTINVPLIGEETVTLNIEGTFGGSLFVTSPTELTFSGAWAASTGEDGFGGDINITVPIDDLKHLTSMPFEMSGNFSVDPDIPTVDPIPIAFNVTGEFPFNISL